MANTKNPFGEAGERIDYLVEQWACLKDDKICDPTCTAILLTGPSGCGKSLVVTTTCSRHELPLIIIDPATIFLQSGLHTASSILNDRCIEASIRKGAVLIKRCDEIFSKHDFEKNERLFHTLMTWIESKKILFFVTSTAQITDLHVFWATIPVKLSLNYMTFGIDSRRYLLEFFLEKNQEKDRVPQISIDLAAENSSGFLPCDLYDLSSALKEKEGDIPNICRSMRKMLLTNRPDFKAVRQQMIPSVNWNNIFGQTQAKEILQKVVNVLTNQSIQRLYRERRVSIPKGIVLYGAPGTGKTLIARIIATQCGSYFLSISVEQIVHAEIGASEKALRNIFREAIRHQPTVIFIDELETLTSGGVGSVPERIAMQLAEEFDNLTEEDKILIVGATNYLEALPDHLCQFGRFGIRIPIKPLSLEETIQMVILELTRENLPVPDMACLEEMFLRITPMTGAEVSAIIDELVAILPDTELSKIKVAQALHDITINGL